MFLQFLKQNLFCCLLCTHFTHLTFYLFSVQQSPPSSHQHLSFLPCTQPFEQSLCSLSPSSCVEWRVQAFQPITPPSPLFNTSSPLSIFGSFLHSSSRLFFAPHSLIQARHPRAAFGAKFHHSKEGKRQNSSENPSSPSLVIIIFLFSSLTSSASASAAAVLFEYYLAV